MRNRFRFCRVLVVGAAVAAPALRAAPAPAAAPAAAPAPPALVRTIKMLPDKAPDCTTLKTIADTVTRGCRNNDEKAVAVYNFMNLSHYHRAYPSEPGGLSALKEINCYGWSLCGGLHSEQSAIWRELGWGWRFVGWSKPGHTTVEARYDDRWHYLDVFLKFYAWMPDGKGGRTIAGEDDLKARAQELLTDGCVLDKGRGCVYAKDNAFVTNGDKANWQAPAFLSCGDDVPGIVMGVNNKNAAGAADGWAGINHASGSYTAEVNLAPGFCLENTWDPQPDAWYWNGQKEAPRHTCGGHKDTRNDPAYGLVLEPYINSKPGRSYANGVLTFAPSFAGDACLASFAATENVRCSGGRLVPVDAGKPASVTVSLATPYILTKASGEAAGADTVEVSVDGGRTFQRADLKDFGAAVKGQLGALVKIGVKDALKSLKIEAVVQNNPGALPFLSPGRNQVTVSVADPAALGPNKLVVTYAYRLGSRTKSFEQLCDQGKEIAKQHNAKWADTVTVAQKTFAAAELPATFVIDCPTPKGQFPVYPRMVFVRREIVAPGASPLPLPAGAAAAQAAAAAELPTLPNPFLVGTEIPAPAKPRAVKTSQIPLAYAQFVSETGEVGPKGVLKWPKVDGEEGKVLRGAVLVTGDLKGLPARGLAAARLMVPVSAGHNMAPGKLGVVLLKGAFEPGKACNVKDLTDTIGTGLIPKQPEATPVYTPAKAVAIDVTRGMKAVASGERVFHGFALRIVPDRGTDEGYTVRCDVSPTEKMWLEVDAYAE
jgi:hypothetical protein